MSDLFEAVINIIFPRRCLICDRDVSDTHKICKACCSNIKYITSPICNKCGFPFVADTGRDHLCGNCLCSRVYFTKARAVGYHEGVLQEAVHQFKYNKRTILSKPLGALMVSHAHDSLDIKSYDYLVPVPLHYKRLRERGFNQSLSLTRHISKRHGVPIDFRSLKRIKWDRPQINLSKKEREQNVKGVFYLNTKSELVNKDVLLIDDDYTSGATVNECAKVLMTAGIKRVDIFTLCKASRNTLTL